MISQRGKPRSVKGAFMRKGTRVVKKKKTSEKPLNTKQKRKLAALAVLPDHQIDTSDIPDCQQVPGRMRFGGDFIDRSNRQCHCASTQTWWRGLKNREEAIKPGRTKSCVAHAWRASKRGSENFFQNSACGLRGNSSERVATNPIAPHFTAGGGVWTNSTSIVIGISSPTIPLSALTPKS